MNSSLPMNDNEHAMSSLLLPSHSFKSRSSTCLPSLESAKCGPLWLKVTELSKDREENVSRNTEISVAEDNSPLPNVDNERREFRQSFKKASMNRVSSKRIKTRTRDEGGRSSKDDQLSPLGRKIIGFVAVSLVFLCMLLVGVTLRLGPIIDEMVRKENEEIYRGIINLPSTAAPSAESSTVGNENLTSAGHPG